MEDDKKLDYDVDSVVIASQLHAMYEKCEELMGFCYTRHRTVTGDKLLNVRHEIVNTMKTVINDLDSTSSNKKDSSKD